MGFKRYTINVEEQFATGSQCTKQKFEWDKPSCAGLNCETDDGRIAIITIPDECDESCFWVTWSCEEDCTDCDPIRLKVCVCDTVEDCEGGCVECINNICVSKCDPDEFCSDADTCIECDDEHPCPNGKICVNGRCVCPPEKPYMNSKGECVPCTEYSCPDGFECTPEGCVPTDCKTGVWNPETKECVECLNSGHCKKENECCNTETNKCECCSGFVRDYETGDCVPAPECEEDIDCPDCEICSGGGCVEQGCPSGQVPVPDGFGGCNCLEECDCDNPNCSDQGNACVSLDDDRCYCTACTGDCTNGCSDGCYCPEGGTGCIPLPCSDIPCTDGSECGPGCGCDQTTNRCRPCDSADCGDECANILGCECTDGVNCEDIDGCGQACDGYGQCPTGCACVGGTCVPCGDFSCTTGSCEAHPECACVSGDCVGDDDFCNDDFTTEKDNCNLEATLVLDDGCLCPTLTPWISPNTIQLTQTVANQEGEGEQAVKVIMSLRIAKGVAETWYNVFNLHVLDEKQYPDIADNDTPDSGTISVEIREFYQPQTWVNNQWRNAGGASSRVINGGGSYSFAGIARKEDISFRATKPGTGANVIIGISRDKIIRYEVSTQTHKLAFPNSCDYDPKSLMVMKLGSDFATVITTLYDSGEFEIKDINIFPPTSEDGGIVSTQGHGNLGNKFAVWAKLISEDSRHPLFIWYRSKDEVYSDSDIVRKIYIAPDSPGTYIDGLYGPARFDDTKQNLKDPEGRLFGDLYYKVINDCACNTRELDFGKVTWCSPDSLALNNITYSNCNKSMVINSDIGEPCSVNKLLSEFQLESGDSQPAFRAEHQAKYVLTVSLEDGTQVSYVYVWRTNGVTDGLYKLNGLNVLNVSSEALKGIRRDFNYAITDITLELKYGDSTEVVCEWDGIVPPPDDFIPTYTTECQPDGKIAYRFNISLNSISEITAVGGIVNSGNGFYDIVADSGKLVTAYIKFGTVYCPITMELQTDCCEEQTIVIERVENDGVIQLKAIVAGGVSPYDVEYYRQVEIGDDVLVGDSRTPNDYAVILNNPTPGLHYGLVKDANDCVAQSDPISVDPRDPTDYNLKITPVQNGCAYTGYVSIEIPNQSDLVNALVYYRVNTNTEQFFTITSQMIRVGEHLLLGTGNTIALVRLEVQNDAGDPSVFVQDGSATIPADLQSEVPAVTGLTLNGEVTTQSVCSGDDVLLEVQGTANARVTFDTISPINLDGSGYGSVGLNPTDTTTYTVTKVTNLSESCEGSQGVGLTRSVSVTPLPAITVVSDACDDSLAFRVVTFSNITSAVDQIGNPITVAGNAISVSPLSITTVTATYDNGICVVTMMYTILPCDCPGITADLVAPSIVCDGEPFTLQVQNTAGGAAPYSYNYYSDNNYNDDYLLGQTSQIFAPYITERYHVRIKDSNDCITYIGFVSVTLGGVPEPDIQPQDGQPGIEEVLDNNFEAHDNLTDIVLKTVGGFSSYTWVVIGGYTGTAAGTDATFSIDMTAVTGSFIDIRVDVVDANGCTGWEQVRFTPITVPVLLGVDELMFSDSTRQIWKVEVTGSSVGVPELVCGWGQPAFSIALTENNDLIGALNDNIYRFNVNDCSKLLLSASVPHSKSLGALTQDTIVSMESGGLLVSYDTNLDTITNPYYQISDAPRIYNPIGDLVRVGNILYGLAYRYDGIDTWNSVLISFTLDGSHDVTSFSYIGILPGVSGEGAYGLAHVNGNTYLIFGSGKVYDLDVAVPQNSTLVGTIVVPGGYQIFDATNNFS